MSEPRKLNTSGADTPRSMQDYEQARLRAQQQSSARTGRRHIQTGAAPGRPAEPERPAPQPEQPAEPARPTRAQLQAMELQRRLEAQRQAAAARAAAGQAAQPGRTIRRGGSGVSVQELDLTRTQSLRTPYDMSKDAAYLEREQRRAERAAAQTVPTRRPPAPTGTTQSFTTRHTRVSQQSVNAAQAQARPQAPAPQPRPAAPAPQPRPAPGGIRMEETVMMPNGEVLHAGSAAPRQAAPAQAAKAAREAPPPKTPPAGGKSGAGGSGGRKPPKGGKNGGDHPYEAKGGAKAKKKKPWWVVLLVTLLVIGLIFGGTLFFIRQAIAPQAGGIKLNQLLNTPKEYQGKELNLVVVGIDRSSQSEDNLAAGSANDEGVNDGMTDMILYVHFNNETGEMKMLQIPRDTMVTTDTAVSANYRINGVAKTQAIKANTMNIPALCTQIADMYQVPVDGYVVIRLEMLTQLVDLFGGVEMNIPFEMSHGGSSRPAGYQTLDGAAVEFVLRTRKIYPDGDIGRLNMQRQFYSALFRKLKSIGNIWDVAKLTPAVLNYMETDLSISELVSFAVSVLKIDSSKIMICQMPVKMGPEFRGHALVYPARQEDADLLNTYFRENTGPVDAAALNLCDDPAQLGFDTSGLTSTDPNIQQMGAIMEADQQAQQNNNVDGSHAVEYDVTAEATPAPEDGAGDGAETQQPAA